MSWIPMHYEDGIFDGTNFDKCSDCGYEYIKANIADKLPSCPQCGMIPNEESE